MPIAALALFGVACSGRGGDDAGRAAPIAECEAYAAQLRACFGREAPGADEAPPAASGAEGVTSLASALAAEGSPAALASVDLATGAAQMTFPFELPAARGDAQPSLTLRYSSSAGVGFAGVGWTLDLPSIVRKGAAGIPQFIDDPLGSDPMGDTYWTDGKQLVPLCTIGEEGSCARALPGETLYGAYAGWTYFRLESDDGNRYFFSPNRSGWIVQTKSGVRLVLGEPLDPNAFGVVPAVERADRTQFLVTRDWDGGRSVERTHHTTDIYRWNLVRQYGATGDTVFYAWERNEIGTLYLTDIYDTVSAAGGWVSTASFAHHVHLTWSSADWQTSILKQSPIWHAQPALRLTDVDVTSQPLNPGVRELVRRYHLDYQKWNPSHTRAYLSSVQLEGRCASPMAERADGTLPATQCPRLPATTFEYTDFPALSAMPDDHFVARVAGRSAIADVRGDGVSRLIHRTPGQEETSLSVDAIVSGDSVNSGMEARPAGSPAAKRYALIADIAPGAPAAIFGDWLGDGRINALWLDVQRRKPEFSPRRSRGRLHVGLVTQVSAPLTGTLPLDRPATGVPSPADASRDAPSVVLMSAVYDDHSNLIQIQRPNGQCAGVSYDAAFQHLPVSTSVYREGCGSAPLTTSRIYDRGLGVATAEISPSLQMTRTVYDGFGRVTEVDQTR